MVLTFDVQNQTIKRTDICRPTEGSKNYLRAKFSFTDDWTGIKTAIFGHDGIYKKAILVDDQCEVPWEIIVAPFFTVSVVCGDLITANEVQVELQESGYHEGDIQRDPTPDEYAQLTQLAERAAQVAQSVRDDADAGLFKGEKGETGAAGPQGDPGEVANISEGEGERSLVFNDEESNRAISECSNVGGKESFSGCKGYFFSAIDLENKKIYLTKTKTTPIIGAGTKDDAFETPQYDFSDEEQLYIGLTNGPPYLFTAKIVSVESNIVSYSGDVGFTSIATDKSDDAYMFFVPAQPDIGEILFANHAMAFGKNVKAVGESSFACGSDTIAYRYAHAEGVQTVANFASHAEGEKSKATGLYSHAEGLRTEAKGYISHTEGVDTKAFGQASHAEGHTNAAEGAQSHAEGNKTGAFGTNSHAEGYNTKTYGSASHAEGQSTVAGDASNSQKYAAHAEGVGTKATHSGAHAEGWSTEASGSNSHAEGYLAKSTAEGAHAEGRATTASGYYSHAEGDYSVASGRFSHAEGCTCRAKGEGSHAGGGYTIAAGKYQEVVGKYNEENTISLFIVGNGTGDTKRSNAFSVEQDGSAIIQTQGLKECSVAQKKYVDDEIEKIGAKIPDISNMLGEVKILTGSYKGDGTWVKDFVFSSGKTDPNIFPSLKYFSIAQKPTGPETPGGIHQGVWFNGIEWLGSAAGKAVRVEHYFKSYGETAFTLHTDSEAEENIFNLAEKTYHWMAIVEEITL